MKQHKRETLGAWFRTHPPESSGVGSAGGAGASSLGDVAVLLFLAMVWAAVYWTAISLISLVRKKSDPTQWADYRGATFCKLEGQNISFWTTVRENSKLLRPSPIFNYDFSALTRFNVFTSTPPRVVFGFTDGQTVELYFDDNDDKLDAIRSAINGRHDRKQTNSLPHN